MVTSPSVRTAPAAISVVLPVRDRRELLADALAGLQAQTQEDFEAFIVDDRSTDGSAEVAEAIAAVDDRFVVLRNEGVGAVAARVAGVARATSPVLAFIDSDCVPTPNWLEVGLEALTTSDADVVQGRTAPARPMLPDERSLNAPWEDGLYATCNVFYRRSAYDAAGGFDQGAGDRLGFRPGSYLRDLGFGEDVLLGWEVRRRGRSAFAADALVHHHVFPPDHRERLSRAWNTGAFPALVREVPELRTTFLTHRVLLGGGQRVPLYAAAAAVALGHPRMATVVLAAWAAHRARGYRGLVRSPQRAMTSLTVDLASEAIAAVALIAGSARTRSAVL